MNQTVHLLVDTGAAISVVSEQFYKDILHSEVFLRTNKLIDNIKTSDGHTTPVIGLVTFAITIGDQTYSCNASVTE